ncbi:MAG: 4Fe-4S binding protein [Dethiobacter sp.]|nr:4Fe-4S binding protein [Dethiobacter sp.]MCL5981949.1 4Fe-4S binding protein [Bacillota bacterium]
MNDYLQRNKSNCKDCYKCIRHCPVKSISFSDNQARIVEDECILCGICFVVCPQNVKKIRNDIGKVKEMIASGRPVYASIAPSFVAKYNGVNMASMEAALKKLGFFAAQETAIGATIVKRHYEQMIREKSQSIIISSCCPSVNALIQKYYPEALAYLAPIISPMQAHSMKIKEEHPEAYTVFIGPCISKKAEAEQYQDLVDCVLTFEDLSEWLEEEGIVFEEVCDTAEKGRARLFPTAGGILQSMYLDQDEYSFISIDGVENCISTIKDVIAGNISNCFIEMSACTGSCIGGPAMGKKQRAPIRDFLAVKTYAGQNDFSLSEISEDKLKKEIPFIRLHRQMPGNSTVEEILKKMGKVSAEQELNCGSCGYNTCRDKAIAVAMGKANMTMCLPFLNEKAQSFSDNIISNTPDGIIVLNEELEIQQINASAGRILNIKNTGDIIGSNVGSILDPTGYVSVMDTEKNTHNKRIYLEKYQRCIEETIIYDKNYHIIIIIMRDITEEEAQRSSKEKFTKHTVEIADKVIAKQMRVVQEIASLLGETAAETKIALTKLKETLDDE